ncbi:MAG: twin-arginine translocase TatA/TatE family subunit [Candidatus Sulfotelmatobacter sp.]
MMTEIIFVVFLGLIVFGPRKTLEMAQKLGGLVAKFKHAASQLQSELTDQIHERDTSAVAEPLHLSETPANAIPKS